MDRSNVLTSDYSSSSCCSLDQDMTRVSEPMQIQEIEVRSPANSFKATQNNGSIEKGGVRNSHIESFPGSYSSSVAISFIHSLISANYTEGVSWWIGAIIMINCTAGIGLLNVPYAFNQVGDAYTAVIVQLFIHGLILMSLVMLFYCLSYFGDVSYHGMVLNHCGPRMAAFCQLCILLSCFGGLVILFVILGDQIDRFLWMIEGDTFCHYWYFRRTFIVPLVSTFIIYPLCSFETFKDFKFINILGAIAMLYITFGVALTRVLTGTEGKSSPHIEEPSSKSIMKIIPVICLSYDCHIEVSSMLPCLKQRSMSYFLRILAIYAVVVSAIYFTVAISAYVTFGSDVYPDFLMGYPAHDPLVAVAMVMLSLKIVSICPIVMFCIRVVVEDVFWRRVCPRRDIRNSCSSRVAFNFFPFFFAVILAVLFPSVTDAINITGGLSAIFEFVFPGLCFMSIHVNQSGLLNKVKTALGIVFVVLGTYMFGSFTTMAIQNFINTPVSASPLCH